MKYDINHGDYNSYLIVLVLIGAKELTKRRQREGSRKIKGRQIDCEFKKNYVPLCLSRLTITKKLMVVSGCVVQNQREINCYQPTTE